MSSYGKLDPADRRADMQQPIPTGKGDVVLDAVMEKLDAMDAVHNGTWVDLTSHLLMPAQLRSVRRALLERAEFGDKKYGTKLRVLNGRDATYDLWQELLDAIMYAMQARMEGKPGGHLVEILIGLAAQIEGRFDI